MDNSDAGTLEKREVVEAVKQNMNEGIQKSSGKKMKNETDKGKKMITQSALGIKLWAARVWCARGEGNLFLFARKKGFEENICGCRTLFLSVFTYALFLALLKGLCFIWILLVLTVGFCVRTVSKLVITDHRCVRGCARISQCFPPISLDYSSLNSCSTISLTGLVFASILFPVP